MTKSKKKLLTKIEIPEMPPVKLPHNGVKATDGRYSFSFSCFDREHPLFNLGGQGEEHDDTVGGRWFLDLLECLKALSQMKRSEWNNHTHQLHPIDWKHTNCNAPPEAEQLEYYQFRISKSKGRVIGFILDQVFYIVWLDPHHNLTDSEGYGKAQYYPYPYSEYELLQEENETLRKEIQDLKDLLEF